MNVVAVLLNPKSWMHLDCEVLTETHNVIYKNTCKREGKIRAKTKTMYVMHYTSWSKEVTISLHYNREKETNKNKAISFAQLAHIAQKTSRGT